MQPHYPNIILPTFPRFIRAQRSEGESLDNLSKKRFWDKIKVTFWLITLNFEISSNILFFILLFLSIIFTYHLFHLNK